MWGAVIFLIAKKNYIILLFCFLADYLAVILAENAALYIQGIFRADANIAMAMPWDYQYIYIPAIFVLIFANTGCYKFNRPSLDLAKDIFHGIFLSFLIYTLLIFVLKNNMQVSRCFLFVFLLLDFLSFIITSVYTKIPPFFDRIG